MTIEEELVYWREENTVLREQLMQRDELIQQQQELLAEQSALLQYHGEQISRLRGLSIQLTENGIIRRDVEYNL